MKKGHKAFVCPENIEPLAVGANIRELRRRAHLSQGELARRLRMRQGPVCNLELGKNLPSAQVLVRLAAILNVTTDRILRPVRYTGHTKAEGSANALEGAGKYQAITRVQPISGLQPTAPAASRCVASPGVAGVEAAASGYLALEDICKVPRQARVPLQVAFDTSTAGLARLAAQFRELFGIGDAVVFDPLELFENHGLRVIFMPLPEAHHLSFYDAPNGNVFIFISADLNPEKQIFGLAYGLGRVLLYNRAVFLGEAPFGNETKADKAARHFAACFLMPESVVGASVGQTGVRPDEWDLEMLLRLKHRFGVSAEAFNYRLLELGLITAERQGKLRAEIRRHYDAHAFAEPGQSRRILSPNGRLGDLLHIALRRREPEAEEIAKRLKKNKIECQK